MTERENRTPERPSEDELMEREEKCRKSIKTVGKAVFMRVFVTALLIWALLQTELQLWVMGLMAFVLVINLSGMFPLFTELKKQRRELKAIMDQYE